MEITRRHLASAGILLAAVLAAFALDRVIVTRRERVAAVIEDMAGACRAKDVERLMSHVAVDYDDGIMNREQLRRLAERVFAMYGAVNVRVRHTVVDGRENEAVADVDVVTDSERLSLAGASQWRVDLRRGLDGEWRMTALRPARIGRMEVTGWSGLMRVETLR